MTGAVLVTMGGLKRVQELERLAGDPDGATILGGDEKQVPGEEPQGGDDAGAKDPKAE